MADKPTNNEFEKDLEEAMKEPVNTVRLASNRVVSLSSQIKELATAIIALDRELSEFDKQVRSQIEAFRKRLGGVL